MNNFYLPLNGNAPVQHETLKNLYNRHMGLINNNLAANGGGSGVDSSTARDAVNYFAGLRACSTTQETRAHIKTFRQELGPLLEAEKKRYPRCCRCLPINRQSVSVLKALIQADTLIEHEIAEKERLFGALDQWLAAGEEDNRDDMRTAVTRIKTMVSAGRTELSLKGLQIGSIPPLPKNLTKLSLAGCGLVRLDGLPSKMNDLTVLDLSDNLLETLVGMPQKLNNVDVLRLDKCALRSLSGISSGLLNLRELYLGDNQLTTISDLPKNLFSLRRLYLEGNQIRTLGDMPPVPALSLIDLRRNRLAAVPYMKWWNTRRLSVLNLSGNPITSLENMPDWLGQLQLLSLNRTDLTSLDTLPTRIRSAQRMTIRIKSTPPITRAAVHQIAGFQVNVVHNAGPLTPRTADRVRRR